MKRTYSKRKLVIVLACVLLFSSGCSTSEVKEEPDTITIEEAVSSEPEKVTEEETAAVDEEEVRIEEELPVEEEQSFGGGSPWIDSNLKCNIKADDKLSPKDDFYLYVNHDWALNTEFEDRVTYGAVEISQEKTNEKAMLLLEDDTLKSHDAELVQTFYQALMDWDARNKAGMEPVMETVRDIQEIKDLEELSDFICDPERSIFVPVFLKVENEVSLDDSNRYITCFEIDSFTLSDAAEYADRTDTGDRRYEANLFLAKALLTRLGYSEAEAEQMFSDMISFEGKIAEKSMTSADEMSPDYLEKIDNLYSPEELSKLTRSYPLTRLLEGYRYDDAKWYQVMEPEAVKRIDELYTEENLDAIKAYMIIGYLKDRSEFLDRESYDAYTGSYSIIYGSTGSTEYKETAFNKIRKYLPAPIDRLYLEKYDQTEKKKRITKICEDVIDAYREMLKGEDWLSDETKEKAIEKLDAMGIHAVYPDKWVDYSGLDLKGLSLYDQLAEIKKYDMTLDRAKTNGIVDQEIWDFDFDILAANARYSRTQNSIYIFLGVLDEPYYYDGISEEALLGSTGAGTIGHEISHAFDAKGSQFDKDGNLTDWWTEEDRKAFSERTDKLIKYYNSITAWDGQQIIGENIQGEATADIVGMKVILQYVKGREDFDYDEFFTAFADSWKTIDTTEAEAYFVTQDPHPLYYLRVNTVVQQFDEFYQTYDIKEGDNMYLAPEDRVSVW